LVQAVAITELEGHPVAVSGGDDRTLRVWDLATGTPIGQPLTGHTGPVLAVATGELDGRPMAVSAGADGTLRVWGLTNLRSPLVWVRNVLRLRDSASRLRDTHAGSVTTIAVGQIANTKFVASGGDDQVVQLRSLPKEMLLCDIALDAAITALALLPSGLLVVGTTQGLAVLELDIHDAN
jgi:WD40 repeat protein